MRSAARKGSGPESKIDTPQFTTEVTSNDVLFGRGAPIFRHPGNIRFREIVKGRKEEYVASSRHRVKKQIAQEIINQIFATNGRFLREVKTSAEANALGIDRNTKAWIIAGEADINAKVKQALRENDNPSVEAEASQEQEADEAPFAPVPVASLQQPSMPTQAANVETRQSFLYDGVSPYSMPLQDPSQQERPQRLGVSHPQLLDDRNMLSHFVGAGFVSQQQQHQQLDYFRDNFLRRQQEEQQLLIQQRQLQQAGVSAFTPIPNNSQHDIPNVQRRNPPNVSSYGSGASAHEQQLHNTQGKVPTERRLPGAFKSPAQLPGGLSNDQLNAMLLANQVRAHSHHPFMTSRATNDAAGGGMEAKVSSQAAPYGCTNSAYSSSSGFAAAGRDYSGVLQEEKDSYSQNFNEETAKGNLKRKTRCEEEDDNQDRQVGSLKRR